MRQAYDQALNVRSADGFVTLDGPGVAITLTNHAAAETMFRLIIESLSAMSQAIPDPDIDQAEGGVFDTPSPNPDTAHGDPRYVPGQDHGSDAPDDDQLKV